jgi:hypothetical protein
MASIVRRKRSRGAHARVSLGGVGFEPDLPFPWVHYPDHYGSVMAFGEKEKGPWFLCECARAPLQNLVELNRRFRAQPNAHPLRRALLDTRHVPPFISELALAQPADPVAALQFRERLCHRCHLIAPAWRYCHEMYGGRFDQAYGWYVNQTKLRLGVQDHGYLPKVCPENIRQLVEAAAAAFATWEADQSRDNYKVSQQAQRLLKNEFINLTRAEFGFRKVGDGWIAEAMLVGILARLFPGTELIRHHRPEWLAGLELDIFLPAHRLAFEYQGQQHFHAIDAWGGEEALEKLQARDRRKVTLCRRQDVSLFHVNYSDPVTSEFVRALLKHDRPELVR